MACMHGCMDVCMHACMFVCMSVCMDIYICTYIYIYIHIFKFGYSCVHIDTTVLRTTDRLDKLNLGKGTSD